jgi:DNA-binding LacI/PurR family transcriptional regulator
MSVVEPHRRRSSVMMDVARLAGVSHQTVSRVLNEHANVSPKTRERVLQAMRELDYQPNSAARTLVTRRSNTLGILTIDSTLYGPASMVYGIEQAARAAGYFVSIASISSMTRRTIMEAVNRLREQGVEGIVAIIPSDAGVSALAPATGGVPVVAVGVGERSELPMVGVDNAAGAARLTRHLLDLGHRTVHHIAGPAGYPDARERRTGWRRTLTNAEAEVPDVLVGDWSPRSGYELGRELARDKSVTAIFCANDQMAIGALRALSEVDRKVPGDVCVVGFDDIPEASYLIPPLTTVRQDFAELGRRAMALFVELATGERRPGPVKILLTPQLFIRESSTP